MNGNKLELINIAQEFLLSCAKGNIREVLKLYADANFKYHNPFFKGDVGSIIIAMEESSTENPHHSFEIKQIITEDNKIVIFSHVKHNPNDQGAALVHIFKFGGNKILEMWDIAQEILKDMINQNSMF